MVDERKLVEANRLLFVCVDSICDYDFNRKENEDVNTWSRRTLNKILEIQLTAEQCKRSVMNLNCCDRI